MRRPHDIPGRNHRAGAPWGVAALLVALAVLAVLAAGTLVAAASPASSTPAELCGPDGVCPPGVAAATAPVGVGDGRGGIPLVSWALDTTGFPARWNCGDWSATLGWMHIASDVTIWAAYMAIPVVLGFFVIKGKTPLPLVSWLFVAFIASCGIGHLLEAVIFWEPVYRLAGVWKVVTAVVSCATVAALVPVVPRALKWPTLGEVNQRLEAEIRERIAMERELELQKFALDEHAIVAFTDPNGVITYANDRFSAISGYTREELIGQTHRIINSGTHPKEFFVDLWRTIAAGQVWRGEICNRSKDGTLYWVDTTIVPFKDHDGRITQYVAIRADITDRKHAEEKLRGVNAELEQFVYTASHDLKSPLITIQGFSGFMQRDLAAGRTDRLQDFAQRIDEAIVRVRENVDDLLELSRIGRVTGEFVEVDPGSVARTVVADLAAQIEQARASIHIDEDMPTITCDVARLRQAIQNLLANALRYGRPAEGDPKIEIGGSATSSEVVLFVRDNGPGIPEQYREKVFGLFQRLSSGTEGTGIGLTIVRRIAEAHGGRAWVESEPGRGASFCIALPRDPAKRPAEAPAAACTPG
ncbi:MAG: ATP-binding protein [Phycisphaerales bacterium]